MKSSHLPCSLLIMAASVLAVGSGGAAVLVNDNFSNSSGSNVNQISNTESVGVGVYRTIQGTTGMSVATVSGFGSGNVLSLANNSNTYFRAFDGGTTLTLNSLAANETLRLTFDVRFDGNFSGADNFSFGFINQTTPNSILYGNVDLSASGGYDSEFRYRPGTFNMADATGSVVLGSGWTEPASVSTVGYQFELSVTKLSDGAFDIRYFRDGVSLGSTTATSGSAFATAVGDASISGIGFRHANTPGVTTYLDNVSVVTVPEPTVGLLLLGGLGAIFLARRLRPTLC